MDNRSAAKRLGAVDRVSKLRIEREISRKCLIGLQPNFETLGLESAFLGVSQQQAPKAPALLLRRDRDVLDPQVIGSQDLLYEPCELAAVDEMVDCCSATAR